MRQSRGKQGEEEGGEGGEKRGHFVLRDSSVQQLGETDVTYLPPALLDGTLLNSRANLAPVSARGSGRERRQADNKAPPTKYVAPEDGVVRVGRQEESLDGASDAIVKDYLPPAGEGAVAPPVGYAVGNAAAPPISSGGLIVVKDVLAFKKAAQLSVCLNNDDDDDSDAASAAADNEKDGESDVEEAAKYDVRFCLLESVDAVIEENLYEMLEAKDCLSQEVKNPVDVDGAKTETMQLMCLSQGLQDQVADVDASAEARSCLPDLVSGIDVDRLVDLFCFPKSFKNIPTEGGRVTSYSCLSDNVLPENVLAPRNLLKNLDDFFCYLPPEDHTESDSDESGMREKLLLLQMTFPSAHVRRCVQQVTGEGVSFADLNCIGDITEQDIENGLLTIVETRACLPPTADDANTGLDIDSLAAIGEAICFKDGVNETDIDLVEEEEEEEEDSNPNNTEKEQEEEASNTTDPPYSDENRKDPLDSTEEEKDGNDDDNVNTNDPNDEDEDGAATFQLKSRVCLAGNDLFDLESIDITKLDCFPKPNVSFAIVNLSPFKVIEAYCLPPDEGADDEISLEKLATSLPFAESLSCLTGGDRDANGGPLIPVVKKCLAGTADDEIELKYRACLESKTSGRDLVTAKLSCLTGQSDAKDLLGQSLTKIIPKTEEFECLPRFSQVSIDIENLDQRRVLLLDKDIVVEGVNFEISPRKCLDLAGGFNPDKLNFQDKVCVDGLTIDDNDEKLQAVFSKKFCLSNSDIDAENQTLSDLLGYFGRSSCFVGRETSRGISTDEEEAKLPPNLEVRQCFANDETLLEERLCSAASKYDTTLALTGDFEAVKCMVEMEKKNSDTSDDAVVFVEESLCYKKQISDEDEEQMVPKSQPRLCMPRTNRPGFDLRIAICLLESVRKVDIGRGVRRNIEELKCVSPDLIQAETVGETLVDTLCYTEEFARGRLDGDTTDKGAMMTSQFMCVVQQRSFLLERRNCFQDDATDASMVPTKTFPCLPRNVETLEDRLQLSLKKCIHVENFPRKASVSPNQNSQTSISEEVRCYSNVRMDGFTMRALKTRQCLPTDSSTLPNSILDTDELLCETTTTTGQSKIEPRRCIPELLVENTGGMISVDAMGKELITPHLCLVALDEGVGIKLRDCLTNNNLRVDSNDVEFLPCINLTGGEERTLNIGFTMASTLDVKQCVLEEEDEHEKGGRSRAKIDFADGDQAEGGNYLCLGSLGKDLALQRRECNTLTEESGSSSEFLPCKRLRNGQKIPEDGLSLDLTSCLPFGGETTSVESATNAIVLDALCLDSSGRDSPMLALRQRKCLRSRNLRLGSAEVEFLPCFTKPGGQFQLPDQGQALELSQCLAESTDLAEEAKIELEKKSTSEGENKHLCLVPLNNISFAMKLRSCVRGNGGGEILLCSRLDEDESDEISVLPTGRQLELTMCRQDEIADQDEVFRVGLNEIPLDEKVCLIPSEQEDAQFALSVKKCLRRTDSRVGDSATDFFPCLGKDEESSFKIDQGGSELTLSQCLVDSEASDLPFIAFEDSAKEDDSNFLCVTSLDNEASTLGLKKKACGEGNGEFLLCTPIRRGAAGLTLTGPGRPLSLRQCEVEPERLVPKVCLSAESSELSLELKACETNGSTEMLDATSEETDFFLCLNAAATDDGEEGGEGFSIDSQGSELSLTQCLVSESDDDTKLDALLKVSDETSVPLLDDSLTGRFLCMASSVDGMLTLEERRCLDDSSTGSSPMDTYTFLPCTPLKFEGSLMIPGDGGGVALSLRQCIVQERGSEEELICLDSSPDGLRALRRRCLSPGSSSQRQIEIVPCLTKEVGRSQVREGEIEARTLLTSPLELKYCLVEGEDDSDGDGIKIRGLQQEEAGAVVNMSAGGEAGQGIRNGVSMPELASYFPARSGLKKDASVLETHLCFLEGGGFESRQCFAADGQVSGDQQAAALEELFCVKTDVRDPADLDYSGSAASTVLCHTLADDSGTGLLLLQEISQVVDEEGAQATSDCRLATVVLRRFSGALARQGVDLDEGIRQVGSLTRTEVERLFRDEEKRSRVQLLLECAIQLLGVTFG